MSQGNELNKYYLRVFEAALFSFQKLLYLSYQIKVARKGKIYDIKLCFHERNFVHLAGIEKLIDIPEAKETPNIYFRLSKNDAFSKFLKEKLVKSRYFDLIICRLYSIIDLRKNFYKAKDNKHYKFISKERGNYTSIDYDFIIKCESGKDIYYYFLRHDDNSSNTDDYVLVSLFINNQKDYTKAQAYMTLLEKVEIDHRMGESVVIYKKWAQI